jgi:excisionase family DNA binding protein
MSTIQTIPAKPNELRPLAYSVAQTAMLLGVSPVSIRRLIARGLLRPNRTLRHLRIPESEITRFLAR